MFRPTSLITPSNGLGHWNSIPESSKTQGPAPEARRPAPASEPEKARTPDRDSSGDFTPRTPRVRLSDVVLPQSTSRRVEGLLTRVRQHQLIQQDWGYGEIDPRQRAATISLYGPPGTGKTLLAEAIAGEFGQPILEIDYAALESKYVGETAKNLTRAFQQAEALGAALFFDEADSMLGRRMSNVTQAADQAVNVTRAVLLKLLDNASGLVLFATNLMRNYDPAFARRILMHVEVSPPDSPARAEILRRLTPPRVPGRELLDYTALAEVSDGLVGGDLKNAMLEALCHVAARPRPEQTLRFEDLLAAFEHIRCAKNAIPSESHPWTIHE